MSVESLKSGDARMLLISPEKLCSRHFIEEIGPSLPPIAYAAIDEAHCISEWSLNFRYFISYFFSLFLHFAMGKSLFFIK
jgi:superfamily II DNA helicase RecQ